MSKILNEREPNLKPIEETYQLVRSLHNPHHGTIHKAGSSIDRVPCTIKRDSHTGFIIEFQEVDLSMEFWNREGLRNFEVHTKVHNLEFRRVHISSYSPPQVKGEIDKFSSPDFEESKQLFFQLFIPLRQKLDFLFYIETYGYETSGFISRNCIRVEYDEVTIDLFIHDDREAGMSFLIIDCSKPLTYDDFSLYALSTLVPLGYVTGHFPQNEGYFIASSSEDFKSQLSFHYTRLRKSIYSSYTPIYRNPHGYIRDRELADSYYPKLRCLTMEEFRRLCKWSHSNIDFSSILLLIIESSTSSLLVMPASYSVALEGLTNLIASANENKLAPIQSKSLGKRIINSLKRSLEAWDKDLTPEGKNILEAKLSNLNQPTNRQKLTKPFKILGFDLSKEDKLAINRRNDFLHCKPTLTYGNDITLASDEIYYTALRLYTLNAVLILKQIGYDSRIVNYPKLNEEIFDKNLDEEAYRQI